MDILDCACISFIYIVRHGMCSFNNCMHIHVSSKAMVVCILCTRYTYPPRADNVYAGWNMRIYISVT